MVPDTNEVIAHPPGWRRDGALVWLDADAEPLERFKMFIFWRHPKRHEGLIYTSPDGIHWNERGPTSQCGDNSSFFYNPFRRRFVFSIRQSWDRRARRYAEHPDFHRPRAGRPTSQSGGRARIALTGPIRR